MTPLPALILPLWNRILIQLAGAMLAGGRRTAASWFRLAGVKDDWDRFYELLQSIGKNTSLHWHCCSM